MPPKNKKELELEAQRAAEEAIRLEEEEKQREAEAKKKYEVIVLPTGLRCIFSDYYIDNVRRGISSDAREFTQSFLSSYTFKDIGIVQNFRPIDWFTLIEFTLYNLRFAFVDLALSPLSGKVLVNIFHEMLSFEDPKYSTVVTDLDPSLSEEEMEKAISLKVQQSSSQGGKTKQKDFEKLKALLKRHSIDEADSQCVKYFTADQLHKILIYANQSYFAHFNLYSFVQKKPRRQVDVFQTVFVDEMTEIPPLESGVFVPLDQKDEEQLERERQQLKQRQIQEQKDLQRQMKQHASEENLGSEGHAEPEDEELDPIALEIIKEKVKETEATLNKQLEDRQTTLNDKLADIEKPKKPPAKK